MEPRSQISPAHQGPKRSVETTAEGVSSRRILKKMPPLEPLDQERRYVMPHKSHVSVFTGFFCWALQANRLGKRNRKHVKMGRVSPNNPKGQRFTQYFSLGTSKDLIPRDRSGEPNIHRNRVIFLALLTAVVIYSLVWITR